MDSATHAKTLRIGTTMNANPQSATLLSHVLNTLRKMGSKDITPEQQAARDRSFVVRCLAVSVVFIVIIFGYSVVKQTQPLFSEAPTDKAIIAVLVVILGQNVQALTAYINSGRSSSIPAAPPMLPAPCPPTTIPTPTLTTPATAPAPVASAPRSVTPSVAPTPPAISPTTSKPPRLDDED